jgi:hypothetical protein
LAGRRRGRWRNFLLYVLLQICKEFEARVGQLKSPRGEKTAAVMAAVERQATVFRVADIQAGCPGVGVDLIRLVLANLQKEGKIKALGTGRGAQWEKPNYVLTNKLRNKLRIIKSKTIFQTLEKILSIRLSRQKSSKHWINLFSALSRG